MLGPNAQISEAVEELTTRNAKLSRLIKQIGTRQDNKQLQQTLDQERQAAKGLCQEIMGLIQRSSQQNASAPARRMIGKLSKQFEEQLVRFRDVEKVLGEKRSAALANAQQSGSGAGGRGYDLEHGGGQQQQQQQQQIPDGQIDIQFLEYDLEEVQRRHQGIQQIEQDIQEIGEMFRDLHALVVEQGESLNVIEQNLVGTKDQTKGAHEELLKAEVYQKKARKKKCCLLFIGVAALAALVLIITYST